MNAMAQGDFTASVEHLTAAIDYTPMFAEAWNMRATVFFLMEKYALSVSDIQQTLKLNPRHFGALSGLGMIFERSGQPKQALEVYKKLLEVHPRSSNAITSVNRLIKDLEGTSL
jgi:tetratricopeptide (TPR) repeat protein